ncbi:MAG TPA: TetR/AcrR family transcriptional regulator [Rhizomicrobium sp.]|nr:TetR/AcrR family transcriptional regulator [Rhizomicrobium sp.]
MADRKRDALSELEPNGLGPEGPRWQQRKSAQTRTAILEAAIDCLSKVGYSGMTTQLIAEVAQISRGAMLHHYATKLELVGSLIDYVFYKRMEWFIAHISALTEKQRVQEFAGLKVYWESLQTRYYTAYLELSIAARSDAELNTIFLPRARRFDRIWSEETLRVFPEWQNKGKAYDLARNFVIAVMEGMLLNREIWNDPVQDKAMFDLSAKVLGKLLSGELSPKKR